MRTLSREPGQLACNRSLPRCSRPSHSLLHCVGLQSATLGFTVLAVVVVTAAFLGLYYFVLRDSGRSASTFDFRPEARDADHIL